MAHLLSRRCTNVLFCFFIKNPTEPCNREVETLPCKAVSYSPLYCSQRPYSARDKSIVTEKGGLQTTSKLISDSFNLL